jgi:hypothetical protein
MFASLNGFFSCSAISFGIYSRPCAFERKALRRLLCSLFEPQSRLGNRRNQLAATHRRIKRAIVSCQSAIANHEIRLRGARLDARQARESLEQISPSPLRCCLI